MTPEEKQRIEQIRERHLRVDCYKSQMRTDIDFLLSLVKSQEAEVADLNQLAETRSDLIAAKAAHIDHLQSRSRLGTTALLRRLKDFLFNNCDHGERDRNYDWCPSCVMAFMEVVAIPSNSDSATSMRSACVEKLRERANRYQALANDSLPNDQTAARTAAAAAALNSAANELETLSIEKPKE